MQRNSRNSRKEDEQSESEPEDVSALIGERPSKNRPGQRTRRKMILQKYGRNALVFQKERDRKSQQATEAAQETLHPSWAAKQRLKAAMSAAIKGGVASSPKKVRLDDERMSSRKVSSSSEKSARQSASGHSEKLADAVAGGKIKVHPSWEAKLKAKAEEAARLEAAKAAKPKIHIKFDD